MKCTIEISGQLHGNTTLFRKLRNSKSVKKRFNWQYISLEYQTKEEARKDIKDAYRELKEEEPDYDGVYIFKDTLFYDASKAVIQ